MKGSKVSYGVAAAVGCAFAVGVVVWLLAPADRDQVTTYAELERDLAEGKVEEVRIDGNEYRYLVSHDVHARRKTTGPRPTLASIAAMRPRAADAVPPKVSVER